MLLFSAVFIVGGAALIVWSREMSVCSNFWTARLRARYPRFFTPPTEAGYKLRVAIMMWLYRAAGVTFAIEGFWALLDIWNAR